MSVYRTELIFLKVHGLNGCFICMLFVNCVNSIVSNNILILVHVSLLEKSNYLESLLLV